VGRLGVWWQGQGQVGTVGTGLGEEQLQHRTKWGTNAGKPTGKVTQSRAARVTRSKKQNPTKAAEQRRKAGGRNCRQAGRGWGGNACRQAREPVRGGREGGARGARE